MHEFKVIEEGHRALQIFAKTELADTTDVTDTEMNAGLIYNMGVREFDLNTSETIFEWWAYPSISLGYSNAQTPKNLRGPFPDGWDWM